MFTSGKDKVVTGTELRRLLKSASKDEANVHRGRRGTAAGTIPNRGIGGSGESEKEDKERGDRLNSGVARRTKRGDTRAVGAPGAVSAVNELSVNVTANDTYFCVIKKGATIYRELIIEVRYAT